MAATKRPKATSGEVWTDVEKAAMAESAGERKAASKRGGADDRAAGEAELRAKVAELPEPDRTMAERFHELVTAAAPAFVPRTYYGMPAWARDGKVICFFQPASKFKVRYSTFGFQPDARIDDGESWPTSFAVLELTPEVEARITALVRTAAE